MIQRQVRSDPPGMTVVSGPGSARAGRAGLGGPGTRAVQGNSQRQLKRAQGPGRPRSRRLAAGHRRLVVEVGERGGFF
jgi:hypothetical protein